MTVQEVLRKTQDFFKGKGFETARLDAELLISHSLGWPRVNLYTQFNYPMSQSELSGCREMVRRRADGEPVAYILGKKGFYNDDFVVSSDVLIPRPETERIVELALERFKGRTGLEVIDLGTGSGCLGLTVLKELEGTSLLAVDILEAALEVAKENAKNLELSEKTKFVCEDAATVELPKADLIVANPPYIAMDDSRLEPTVKKFEPDQALYAEDEGLSQIFSWTQKAIGSLKPHGRFFCEMGMGQRPRVEQFLTDLELDFSFYRDYSEIERGFEVING